ncbi:hypothetical protein C8Q80DRAFT_582374 [Daedaleopsis nitida]|nr:hypothetical protein C8Q80DRAFT_582374 [Daedaleopsis nitida]
MSSLNSKSVGGLPQPCPQKLICSVSRTRAPRDPRQRARDRGIQRQRRWRTVEVSRPYLSSERACHLTSTARDLLGPPPCDRFHRSKTRPHFSRDRISQHLEMFDRYAELSAIRKMKERFAGGHALDFQDLIARPSSSSAGGRCVHSFKTDLPYAQSPDRFGGRVPAAANWWGRRLLGHLVKFTDDPAMLHDETLNIMVAGRNTASVPPLLPARSWEHIKLGIGRR